MAFTLSIGDTAPDFMLPATDGKIYSLKDFDHYRGLVIAFICNHCPFVTGSEEVTRNNAEEYLPKGIGFAMINSNSANTYPEDSFDNMKIRMEENKFPWIYMRDRAKCR